MKAKFHAVVGTAILLLNGLAISGAQAQPAAEKKDTPKKEPIALPAQLSGFRDSGTFFLYKDEERLATMTFSWTPDGTFDGHSTLAFAGQTVKQSTKIVPEEDGRWATIAAEIPTGAVSLVRDGGIVRVTRKGKTETIKLKPGAVLFDNFGPALLSQTIRAYDRTKGGKQSFSILIIPGAVISGTLSRKDEAERTVGGRDTKFIRYTLTFAGLDAILWTDDSGKLYLAEIPTQRAAYIREGYEILRRAPETDPLISRPDHQVTVERNVAIPMRDGIRLKTDIYRPDGSGKVPIILIRTPYKKELNELKANYFARRGFAVAVQDCRGRFGSPGIWEPFINEPKDGYDAVEWLGVQPWCNGKVGMIGGSYLGWVQWWAAVERPPHLVTIIPNVAPPDPFYNLPYEYGVFFLWASIWWADVLESGATADISGAAMAKTFDRKFRTLLRSLPVVELDKKVLGRENPYWRKWIDHSVNDSYWEQTNFLDRLKDVRIPAFHQSGWFDGDGIGTKLNYAHIIAGPGHGKQKLILGPWGHTDESTSRHEGREFGREALVDLQRAFLRWFDYWLKGVENGIDKEPLVSIFVMGSNQWLRGDVYPLGQTRFEKWYLASSGKANTSKGNGRLTRQPPPENGPADRYTYNPGDPTPSPSFYEEPEDKPSDKMKSSEEKAHMEKAYHATITDQRQDILVYVSEPFKEPYTFAGPISAVLYALTSARDTDWFVRLMEVDEKGEFFSLVEGKVRARFRQSTHQPVLLEPGKVYPYTIDLWQTGMRIPAGRRLRVEVASASFPLFSRNLNTGGHNEKDTNYVPADQVIYHCKEYPSHILLPAIPDGEDKAAASK